MYALLNIVSLYSGAILKWAIGIHVARETIERKDLRGQL